MNPKNEETAKKSKQAEKERERERERERTLIIGRDLIGGVRADYTHRQSGLLDYISSS